jgi:ABC-2 type transport system permease protein
MKSVGLVALHELLVLWRSRVAAIALTVVVLLSGVSAAVGWERARVADETRARLQAQADVEFDAQPNRHPHRMVHYGHFAFRPLDPLAAFDPGIDAFAGSVIYLEGHRQNSANFADVRQSSLLLRFGQLTPAFVLQTLLPLLLIVLGAGVIARERERGSLRLVLSSGVSPRQLLVGKTLALLAAGVVATAPAVIALGILAARAAVEPWLVMVAGYGIYLLIWTLGVVLVSAIAKANSAALRFLLGAWAVLIVMLPRLAPEVAALNAPVPARFETEFAVQRELRSTGDSHDENDPYFAAFKQKTLDHYGVTRVEDLPVNYKGLLAVEGERMTSELFDRHAARTFGILERQVRTLDASSVLSPLPAIRRLSMAAAQTDLGAHRRFVEQAERFRYEFVQKLNQLQAEAVTFADDVGRSNDAEIDRRTRIDSKHWQEIPDFHYVAEKPADTLRRTLPALAILFAWAVALSIGLSLVWRRTARSGL